MAEPADQAGAPEVLPHVSVEIFEEAKRRGVQQGVLIEEARALYIRRTD